MSVENINVIDSVGIDKDGQVILTIVDHLEWDNENEHLLILQDKINAYLRSIESGELLENYPQALHRKIRINLMYTFMPNESGKEFLEQVKQILNSAGYSFTQKLIEITKEE